MWSYCLFIKTPLNNVQPYKVHVLVHFLPCTLFSKFRKMAPGLFVIAFVNSSAYIVLWNRFCNACQYTPLLAAHQELWELVLSWFFSGKTSRLRLEMNGRCLKILLSQTSELLYCYCLIFSKKKIPLAVRYFIPRQKNILRMVLTLTCMFCVLQFTTSFQPQCLYSCSFVIWSGFTWDWFYSLRNSIHASKNLLAVLPVPLGLFLHQKGILHVRLWAFPWWMKNAFAHRAT